ncbi:MAG: hypothetical protein A2583_02985 [Bdellovibrionales bacterium RIFOXYD1_FULL_53_11]|nr:MAG: hypothetical protein A2583_02985 [Bdellovibrionales bacterium RIFOXYD1_FULL_53_11]
MSNKKNIDGIYAGTFTIACATLLIEITLTRILSVVTWYYLAYFAISLAMLGMTAGAITVYFKKENQNNDELLSSVARACLGFAWATPVSLILICLIPLFSDQTLMNFLALFFVSLSCSIPFYFSGIVLTTVLTRAALPVGKVYAADLIGSAFACLMVLFGLSVTDPYTLILAAGALGALAGWLFVYKTTIKKYSRPCLFSFVALTMIAFLNADSKTKIRPLVVKDAIEAGNKFYLERWNSFSRVAVGHLITSGTAQFWGASPKWVETHAHASYPMVIDGSAATSMRRFNSPADLDHLRYDVTNIGYHIAGKGLACIIGVGGGRDVQSALLFGHPEVVGVELNPTFIDLLTNDFAGFAMIGKMPNVRLVADEARSYYTTHQETCSVIQMSLIDTWAATAAGAYSLSENALYTREAWKVFLNRLIPDGLFFVTRWYSMSNMNELARITSLAITALFDAGATNPAQHIAVIGQWNVGSFVIGKSPLKPEQIAKLRAAANDLQFAQLIMPDQLPDDKLLRSLLVAGSKTDLDKINDGQDLNISAPTDENPYFFNMLKLSNLNHPLTAAGGNAGGNLRATKYLLNLILILFVLVLSTLVIPLLIKSRGLHWNKSKKRIFIAGIAYFSLIGTGFMFLEVAMIQRLNIYLGHPTYSLAVLLFAIILSTGCGSYLTEKIPFSLKKIALWYPAIIAGSILALRFLVTAVISTTITWEISIKIFITVLLLFPMGLMLGICFPLGMRLIKGETEDQAPWYWALNGIFGVFSSCLAVLVSIYLGVSISFYIASACYLGLVLCNRTLAAQKSLS